MCRPDGLFNYTGKSFLNMVIRIGWVDCSDGARARSHSPIFWHGTFGRACRRGTLSSSRLDDLQMGLEDKALGIETLRSSFCTYRPDSHCFHCPFCSSNHANKNLQSVFRALGLSDFLALLLSCTHLLIVDFLSVVCASKCRLVKPNHLNLCVVCDCLIFVIPHSSYFSHLTCLGK